MLMKLNKQGFNILNDEVAFEKKVVEIKERYQGNFKKVLGNNRPKGK